MKKSILIIISLCFTILLQAEVSKIVNNLVAGGLLDSLSVSERSTVSKLTLMGTVDARDFRTMRDSMPALAVVDLSATSVLAYKGVNGTWTNVDTTYIANAIPDLAFCDNVSFIGKKTLTSFVFPAGVSVIGADAFDDCTGLIGEFTIPATVDSIGIYAFYGCVGLSKVELPSMLKHIPEGCFQNCTALTGALNIPLGVDFIGDYAFYNTGYTSVIMPSSVTTIFGNAFKACTNLSAVSIPSSVTFIGTSAFYGCTSLSTITIPSSVTTIERAAFMACTGLTSIKVSWTNPVQITSTVFGNVDKTNCILHVPAGTVDVYDAAICWTDFINIKEDVVSATNNTSAALIKIGMQNGQVYVTGAVSGEGVSLYNLNGILIHSQKAVNETEVISLPAKGMYVVKVGTQTHKVIF